MVRRMNSSSAGGGLSWRRRRVLRRTAADAPGPGAATRGPGCEPPTGCPPGGWSARGRARPSTPPGCAAPARCRARRTPPGAASPPGRSPGTGRSCARLNSRTKRSISRGMSSRRSRSGGSSMRRTLRRWYRSRRNSPDLHLLAQVPVGGGDDAHVHPLQILAADAAELTLLQHAQQLGLRGERHLPDLVEEDGAAVGQLEEPLPERGGAGEGALLVPEELATPGASRAAPRR